MAWLREHFIELANLLAVLGGFWIAYNQLSETSTSLKDANAYSILRDSREIAEKVGKDESIRKCLESWDVEAVCSLEHKKSSMRSMASLFNFYSSVFRFQESKGISADLSRTIGKDFCSWFKLKKAKPLAEETWKYVKLISDNDPSYILMRKTWCEE